MAARDADYAARGQPITKAFRFPKEVYPSPARRGEWRESVAAAAARRNKLFASHSRSMAEERSGIPLADVLRAANKLVSVRLIKDYALGGVLAAIYYTEPFTTYDAGIIFVASETTAGIPAIYSHLQSEGWRVARASRPAPAGAMAFLDSQSTNYDSRNDLRFADHVQHPVQKQGRPVPNRSLEQCWLRPLAQQSSRTDRSQNPVRKMNVKCLRCNPATTRARGHLLTRCQPVIVITRAELEALTTSGQLADFLKLNS